MRGDERLLHKIECFVGFADAGSREPENRLSVAPDDLGESGLPTGYAECRQLAIGQCGPIQAHPWPSVSAFTTAASNWEVWSGRRSCRMTKICANVAFCSSPIAAWL